MRRTLPLLLVLALLVVGGAVALLWSIDPTGTVSPRPRARAPVAEPVVDEAAPDAEIRAPVAWPADAPRTLQGVVRDEAGAPVVGATVRAERGERVLARGRADAKGAYRLSRVPVPIDRVVFAAPGFEPYVVERPTLPREPRVTIDAVLEAEPGVRGRVIVADGTPAAEALVLLRRVGDGRAFARARTDEAGRFGLKWPGDRAWFLSAFHAQHGKARVDDIEPGSVEVVLPGGGWIEGRVIDEDGAPVPAFSISATPLTRFSGGPPAQSFDNAEGRFRLGPLAPGYMHMWAVAEGYQPGEKTGLSLKSGQTLSGFTLRLSRSTVLTGRVTDARTGRPIEGAQVRPAEWQAQALAEAVGGYTDADGRYRLDALPGGRTSITVSAEGYKRLLLGGVEGAAGEITERDFALTPSDGRRGGELTGIGAILRRHPRGVRLGSIVDGGPASQALTRGDVITAVDGRSLRGKSIREVVQNIRGEEGTEVVLTVLRGGQGEAEQVVLERSRVSMPSPHRRN